MAESVQPAMPILVASESSADAELIKKLLAEEYPKVAISIAAEQAVQDFELYRPSVLILAFRMIKRSERYYLGLYRKSSRIQSIFHRTILLCAKEELKSAYRLCRDEHFDDYVLFWPMNHDALRLLIAVHHALHNLDSCANANPISNEITGQIRRLAELESLLGRQIAQNDQHAEFADRVMTEAAIGMENAFDRFAEHWAKDNPSSPTPLAADALRRELGELRQEVVFNQYRNATATVEPFKHWAKRFGQDCAPHFESIREITSLTEHLHPTVMIVDDDDFQRNLLGKMLEQEGYRLLFARDGMEALGLLRKERPDLVLMDVMMPDISGIEVVRRMKLVPHLASLPVVMITGRSEGNIVADSMKAGIVDFLVKPVLRDTLLTKVARALSNPPKK